MRLIFWIIFGLVQRSLELEINLTKFDNCLDVLPDGEEWPVEIKEVHYDNNDNGFIDHVYGNYLVRTIDKRHKEVTIDVYKCSIIDHPPCKRMVEHIDKDLQCEQFRNDDSGIWYLVSQAMSGSACGEDTGIFEFEISGVNYKYFEKYLLEGEQSSRYRIQLLFHKKNDQAKERRACAEIHLDIYH